MKLIERKLNTFDERAISSDGREKGGKDKGIQYLQHSNQA